MIDSFRTSITDVRSLIKTVTLFFDKIGAGLVTGGTGSTLNAAEYDFSAYVCFSAVISVNAEVVSLKEGSFMIPCRHCWTYVDFLFRIHQRVSLANTIWVYKFREKWIKSKGLRLYFDTTQKATVP